MSIRSCCCLEARSDTGEHTALCACLPSVSHLTVAGVLVDVVSSLRDGRTLDAASLVCTVPSVETVTVAVVVVEVGAWGVGFTSTVSVADQTCRDPVVFVGA